MPGGLLESGEFYSALTALVWAIAVVLFRRSGELLPPIALNLFKDVVGLVLFLVLLLVSGQALAPPERSALDWALLLASGAIGIGIADSLFFASLNRLGAGRAAIVDCIYSPFVILTSFAYLDEPIGVPLLAGTVFMGAAIVIGAWQPEERSSAAARREQHYGVLLGLLSIQLMAVAIVMAKPALDRSDALWATAVRLVGGVAVLAVLGLGGRQRAAVVRAFRPGPLWRITMPAALLGGFAAMYLWILGMKLTMTNIASVLNQLSAVFILVLATVFLKEPLTVRKTVAIALGFAGGVVATL